MYKKSVYRKTIYKKKLLLLLSVLIFFITADCSKHSYNETNLTDIYLANKELNELEEFINMMHVKHGFSKLYLKDVFSEVVSKNIKQLSTPKTIAKTKTTPKQAATFKKPLESKDWHVYRDLMVNNKRISRGTAYYANNKQYLLNAEKQFGVPPHIITAILGIETNYGSIYMPYRAVDALFTLSFINTRRGTYFKKELEALLLLADKYNVNPTLFRSSYAGALGIPQFMPSNISRYGIDGDGDGVVDIINSHHDAIFSIANYLVENGWKRGKPVSVKVKLKNNKVNYNKYISTSLCSNKTYSVEHLNKIGVVFNNKDIKLNKNDKVRLRKIGISNNRYEYYIESYNLCVITKYNKSLKYAMAVSFLADNIATNGKLNVKYY